MRVPSPRPTEEPRWHASLAVLVAVLLYIALPPRLELGPVWIVPLLIGVILIPLSILAPNRHKETAAARVGSIILIALLSFFNIASVLLLVNALLGGASHSLTGKDLLTSGGAIWMTNILVFALWFWEVDGGGPHPRAHATPEDAYNDADFLFPQMTMAQDNPSYAKLGWKPMFIDYLYLGFTNALAFSPTDAMPLSQTAKMLMLLESLISFVAIALIVSRSINILS